jgi:hypothetical protein
MDQRGNFIALGISYSCALYTSHPFSCLSLPQLIEMVTGFGGTVPKISFSPMTSRQPKLESLQNQEVYCEDLRSWEERRG